MSETRISWSANETEFIEPFKTFSKGLEPCALRLRPSESFDQADTRVITAPDFWTDFRPAVRIDANLDELASATGLGRDGIMVSVVIRDRDLNRFARAYQCEAWALPAEPVELTSAWSEFSQSGRVDVSVVATPAETADRGPGIASHKADVVARRTFKLRTMTQSSKIPSRWVPPEEFEKRGTSGDTVWLIDWLGDDLERSPAETVMVLLNENLREAFQVLENDGEMANLIRYEMTAAIFSELAKRAIVQGDEPIEQTGLRKVMFEQLSSASGLNDDEILALRERPNFFGVVHAWAQKYAGLNHSFDKL